MQIKLAQLPGKHSRIFTLAVDAAYDVPLAVVEQSMQCPPLHSVNGIVL